MRVFRKVLKNVKFARSFKSVRSARNANFLRKSARFFRSFAREFSANFSANFKSFFSDFFVNFASFLTFKSSVKSVSFWSFERNIFGKNVFKFFDYFKFLVFVVFVKFFKYFKSFRVFERESGYG